jgi:hypothetical protein
VLRRWVEQRGAQLEGAARVVEIAAIVKIAKVRIRIRTSMIASIGIKLRSMERRQVLATSIANLAPRVSKPPPAGRRVAGAAGWDG